MARGPKGDRKRSDSKGRTSGGAPKKIVPGAKAGPAEPSCHDVIQVFYRVLDQITEQSDTTTINNSVLEAALELTGAAVGLVGEVDPDGRLKIVAIQEKGKPLIAEPMHERIMAKGMPFKGYLAKILTLGNPHIENMPGSEMSASAKELLNGHPGKEYPIANMLFVPFKVMGHVLGAILLANKPGGFTTNDKEMMFELARLTSIGRSKILALSAALRNTTDGIALMDRNGVLNMVNPAMENMFNYKASELEGRSLLGIFLEPDTGSPLGEAIAGAVIDGVWSGEALGLRKNGTMFPVHMTVTVVEEATAPRTGFMLMVRDITVEKETQDRARQYLETAEVVLLALDLEGKVTMLNRKGEELIGRPRGEVLGKDWFSTFVPEAQRAQARKAFDAIFEGQARAAQGRMGMGAPRQKEGTAPSLMDKAMNGDKALSVNEIVYPVVDHQGRERLIHWEHAPLKNHKGLVVGAMFSGIDITEQRLVEERLRSSETLYKTMLKLSPDAIVMSDTNGIIQDLSEKACELYGTHDPYDLIGKSSFEFIHPDEREKAARGLQRTLKDGTVRTSFHLIKKDGTTYPAELTTTIVRDKDGRITGFLGFLQDLSEKELAAKKLKAAEESYRLIFENSPVGIVRINLVTGKPVLANQVAAEHMGFRNADELLDNIDSKPILPPGELRLIIERIKRKGHLKDFPLDFKKVDGTEGRFILNATLLPGADYVDLFGIDISRIKEMESKLNEVERAFGGIMDASFLSFARFSIKDGRIVLANKRLARRYGYDTVEELLQNITSRDMWTDKQREEIRGRLLKDGILENYETEIKLPDGTKIWGLTYSRLDRETGYIDAMSIDITGLKRAEERLREAEQMYKALFDTMTTAVAKIDITTGKVIMANEASARLFGYDSISEFTEAFETKKDFGLRFFNIRPMLERDGAIRAAEYDIPRKDGTMAKVVISATLDRQKGEVIFSAVDVSQFKELEARLRSTEQLYRHLFENTPVGVSRIRIGDWTVVAANKALLEILGANSIEDLNDPANKSNFFPMAKVEENIERLRTIGSMSNVELEVSRVDGGKKNVLVYATLDSTGEHLDNVVMDITRLKDAEARLGEAVGTYWQLFKASTVGQARVGVDGGKVSVCNEAFARLLGYASAEQLVKGFALEQHVKDLDLWKRKVTSSESGDSGVGWLPASTNPPTIGTTDTDAKSVLIGVIPGITIPMVRKDGKELSVLVSGVVYMGKGFMDLTFIDIRLLGTPGP